MDALVTKLGSIQLRNPIIAGPADHFIDDAGVRRAIKTGVGAVVLTSDNKLLQNIVAQQVEHR